MYTDDTILTWGKHKFTSLKNIPASWLLSKHKCTGCADKELIQYIADNYGRLREREEQEKGVMFIKIAGKPPICDKYQYRDEDQAKKHLREIRRKGPQSSRHILPVRAYPCPICNFWHLTSKK